MLSVNRIKNSIFCSSIVFDQCRNEKMVCCLSENISDLHTILIALDLIEVETKKCVFKKHWPVSDVCCLKKNFCSIRFHSCFGKFHRVIITTFNSSSHRTRSLLECWTFGESIQFMANCPLNVKMVTVYRIPDRITECKRYTYQLTVIGP